jgi:hypothetical protein
MVPAYYYAFYHLFHLYRRDGTTTEAMTAWGSYMPEERFYSPDGFSNDSVVLPLKIRYHWETRQLDGLTTTLKERGNDLFYSYFTGLLYTLQGNAPAAAKKLEIARQQAAAIDSPERYLDNGQAYVVSNASFVHLFLEDYAQAEKLLRMLTAKKFRVQILYYSLPHLDDLIRYFPERQGLKALRDKLSAILFPAAAAADPGPERIDPDELYRPRQPRGGYAFPMYCQLSGIQGLQEEGVWANKILEQYKKRHAADYKQRVVVFFTIKDSEHTDRLFAYCNFKQEEAAEFNFKFCDTEDKILQENLQVLVQQYGVSTLVFSKPDLAGKFKKVIDEKGLIARCLLVHFKSSDR